MTKTEVDEVWKRVYATANWWMRLDAFTENVGAMQVFFYKNYNHDIWIVTARGETLGMSVAKQTQIWIDACGVQTLHNYLAVFPVEYAADKSAIYKNAGIKYSVDDKGETVVACDRHADSNHKAFLLDRPWNQDFDVKRRVKNLDEFFREVENDQRNR